MLNTFHLQLMQDFQQKMSILPLVSKKNYPQIAFEVLALWAGMARIKNEVVLPLFEDDSWEGIKQFWNDGLYKWSHTMREIQNGGEIDEMTLLLLILQLDTLDLGYYAMKITEKSLPENASQKLEGAVNLFVDSVHIFLPIRERIVEYLDFIYEMQGDWSPDADLNITVEKFDLLCSTPILLN